jgi:hypothetical protein
MPLLLPHFLGIVLEKMVKPIAYAFAKPSTAIV